MHHAGTQLIETERLILDRLTRDDVDSISSWSGDPAVYQYLSAYPKSRAEVEKVVGMVVDAYARPDCYYWAIRIKGSKDVIGVIFMDTVYDRNCMCAVEFILARRHWGFGYAEEALRAIINYMFTHTDCHRMQAKAPINHRAGEVTLHRVGMFREGVLREAYMDKEHPDSWNDMVIYGVLSSEWQG